MAVDPLQKKRLRALARLEERFADDQADAPFRPSEHPDSPDYNVHHVHIDADPDAEAAFVARGLAIVRGDVDDELDEILAS